MHDRLAPHFLLLQFLASHYHATRFSSSAMEKMYIRLFRSTLRNGAGIFDHPLARELQFHIVLLALKVLKLSTSIPEDIQWRIKDDILSFSLDWFKSPPRYGYSLPFISFC